MKIYQHWFVGRLLSGLLAVGLALGLAACDQHKAERQRAENLLSEQQAEVSNLQRQLEQDRADLAQVERALMDKRERHEALKEEQAQREARFIEYLGQHKAAAAAAFVALAGAATALDDKTRDAVNRALGQNAAGAIQFAGVVGVVYCLAPKNRDECASVGSYIASYATESEANNQHLTEIAAQWNELREQRDTQQQTVNTMTERLEKSRAAMTETEAEVERLRCRGLFC